MKSFIFAVILSLIIISGGSFLSQKIESASSVLSQNNKELQINLTEKNAEKSIATLDALETEFKKHKVLFEATADHEELLRIELQYKSIREFIKEDQFGDALAACAEIELLLNHLPGSFELKGENIL